MATAMTRKPFVSICMAAATALALSAGAAPAAQKTGPDSARQSGAAVLVLMGGTRSVHVIRMPDMASCRRAAEYSTQAECLDEAAALAREDVEGLSDIAPAAGPAAKPAAQ